MKASLEGTGLIPEKETPTNNGRYSRDKLPHFHLQHWVPQMYFQKQIFSLGPTSGFHRMGIEDSQVAHEATHNDFICKQILKTRSKKQAKIIENQLSED